MFIRRFALWIAAGIALASATTALGVASSTFVRQGARYAVDRWETDDGLPQNSVIAMAQTRDGYLWLGTLNGLVRFDGLRFTVFDEKDTPGLPGRRIVFLFEDSRGDLWLGTETAGAALIREGKVTPLDLGRGSRDGRLVSAAESPKGTVWLYTADGQLCRHRDGRVDVWRLATEQFNVIRLLATPRDSPMLVAAGWRLLTLGDAKTDDAKALPVVEVKEVPKLDFLLASRGGGHWRLTDSRVQKWSGNDMERDLGSYPWGRATISAACEDAEGNLVVGTLGQGVYWFDGKGGSVRLGRAEGLSHDYVLSLLLDREGNLWIGTDGGGVNRVRRQIFDVLEDSLGKVVQSVCEDAEGGLWVGYLGGWVEYWKGSELRKFEPGTAVGVPELPIRSVITGRAGEVWVGTWRAGVLALRGAEFSRVPGLERLNPFVSALLVDRSGHLWIGTRSGLGRWDGQRLRVYGAGDGLDSVLVQALAEDKGGSLWVGTGDGVYKFGQDRFGRVGSVEAKGLESISALSIDDEGTVWAGLSAGGLLRFAGARRTQFDVGSGLERSEPGFVLGDDRGGLWIGTSAGLMRASRAEIAAEGVRVVTGRVYGRPDGLPTRECAGGSQPGAWRGRDGRLWFATIKGLAAVTPSELRSNPQPPPVVVESVLIEGQPASSNRLTVGVSQQVVVPAGRERIEIQYTSLNLAAPERAVFRYRLERHEADWTEAGASRVARYSRLPPGSYRFQVKAANEDGVWNETGSSLALIVEPPFWKTWWFLGMVALVVLGTIVGVVHLVSTQRLQRQLEGLRQQQALERERTRIARDIHDQVGASLTQVSLLGELVESDSGDPAEVSAHGRQISQTARETTRVLDEIVWAVNPSNDTLEGLLSYFCKNAQEYLEVAGLRYRVDVPADLPSAPIPPDLRHNVFLAAKEAVTNIVRHARATEARIRLRLDSDRFTLEVEDNGKGMADFDPEAARLRNGLTNMRRRLSEVGGSCEMLPAPGGGTLVRLSAPLPKGGLDSSPSAG